MKRRIPAAMTVAFAVAVGAAVLGGGCTPREEPAAPVVPVAPTNTAGPAIPPATPAVPGGLSGAELARAQLLFRENCAECHLETGKGDPHHRKDDVPDFTNIAWQDRESDEDFFKAIKFGEGKVMPAFEEDLTDEEIRLLVRYIRRFAERPGEPAAQPAAPPASGGH